MSAYNGGHGLYQCAVRLVFTCDLCSKLAEHVDLEHQDDNGVTWELGCHGNTYMLYVYDKDVVRQARDPVMVHTFTNDAVSLYGLDDTRKMVVAYDHDALSDGVGVLATNWDDLAVHRAQAKYPIVRAWAPSLTNPEYAQLMRQRRNQQENP